MVCLMNCVQRSSRRFMEVDGLCCANGSGSLSVMHANNFDLPESLAKDRSRVRVHATKPPPKKRDSDLQRRSVANPLEGLF